MTAAPLFAHGDRVRLRSVPEAEGIVHDTNGHGEVMIDWQPPYDYLDANRLPAELEAVPPPELTIGERVWLAMTVESGPDEAGDWTLRSDSVDEVGGWSCYVNRNAVGNLLRPEVVR